ncbi:hypothetical protein [uncultured Akkermansia sp.]|jgi:hypothetical protein|uniref:hypothetical protein n=1 Tax=Akkermansia sp. TaxID=1872421 RepID=UPI00266D3499|nr:hypothetical protein [uncultured Akkermansia sp.]
MLHGFRVSSGKTHDSGICVIPGYGAFDEAPPERPLIFIQPPFPCLFPVGWAACKPTLQFHKPGHFLSPERFPEHAPEIVPLTPKTARMPWGSLAESAKVRLIVFTPEAVLLPVGSIRNDSILWTLRTPFPSGKRPQHNALHPDWRQTNLRPVSFVLEEAEGKRLV